ncbi:hypothetical protein [Candidatus Tisiphia endosymbiont of Hybos culiciformis]|uniref:hypothetical protein n=1 Tax=Candidatus Tisiphia endosymbiont of Hybos culiciformis TaxID=3139331 RepID=UPI003CCAC708
MKSRTSSEPLSKISSTQARIKPELESLSAKYGQALTTLDEIINSKHITATLTYDSPDDDLSLSEILALTITPDNADERLNADFSRAIKLENIAADKKSSLLQLDVEYVEMTKRAFDAISKEMGYTRVDFGGWHHLNQNTSCPYEILHATFCGKQGQHFNDMINHYCNDNPKLTAELTTFVSELNTTLQPFVPELHKNVNACKVSYNGEKELLINYSSAKIAKKVMDTYKDTLKFAIGTDPLKLEGDHIVVRSKTSAANDVGVYLDGTAVSLPSKNARDAFLHLFEGSNLAKEGARLVDEDGDRLVYFTTDKDGNSTLPIEFIGSNMEFCGDWL